MLARAGAWISCKEIKIDSRETLDEVVLENVTKRKDALVIWIFSKWRNTINTATRVGLKTKVLKKVPQYPQSISD